MIKPRYKNGALEDFMPRKQKRARFDYEHASYEDIVAYKQKLFESNKLFFGKTYRERYREEIKRFNLPNTMGMVFNDPALARAEAIRQIELMTGKFAYNRGRQARENMVKMIDKLGGSEALKKYASKISLKDLERHSEEYDYLFRMLEGYGEADKEGIDDEDILGDIADTFLEIERRKKEAKGEEFDDEDELELLSDWEV